MTDTKTKKSAIETLEVLKEMLGPMTEIGPSPTKKDLIKFIEVFDILCNFEAEQRNIRGYGLFPDGPVPEVMVVRKWLSRLVEVCRE